MENLSERTMKAYRSWLSSFPESGHYLDERRFYRFIKTALDNGEKDKILFYLENNLKSDCKQLSDEQVNSFIYDAGVIIDFQDI